MTAPLPPTGSPRVAIVRLDAATLAALAAGDLTAAQAGAPVPLAASFVEPGGIGVWQRRARQIVEDPTSAAWITGVVRDVDRSLTVGRAGFHGPPDEAGMVEIGYEVEVPYRRRGYGRATVAALLAEAARDPRVVTVRATISPDNEASRRLVAGFGFVEVGEQWDDEDGLETVFERPVAPQA